MQLLAFFHILRHTHERVDRLGRQRQAHLQPVHLFAVSAPRKVLRVVGVVIVGVKEAQLIKSFDQHALAVHVRKAQRTVHGLAVEFPRPRFHRVKQRVHNLVVVDKIDLREAHILLAECRVRTGIEYSLYPAYDFSVPAGEKRFGFAKLERRVFILLHVGYLT